MKVLVLGATGYIGGAVAAAFTRGGHETAGAYRDDPKADMLAAEEIAPVPWINWTKAINTFDVVVDCTKDMGLDNFRLIANASRQAGRRHHPITYIYTSGIWVHGPRDQASDSMIADERNEMTRTLEWYAVKSRVESEILSSDEILSIVIRPGVVYGRGMGMLNTLFGSAYSGHILCPGAPGARWSTIHVEDLADLFVKVADSVSAVRYRGSMFLIFR
ncbi:NAD(P)-binding protein [Calocera viscosa TUFC12733]|uniref:NAD(P)-binding protein n=1 Tax=Calocera viscosa (strain TUFC12733) TaxID=1330018 RepID=A0A167LPK0_CALVF|nr:NAD(P)-binding protein [Calocera viscosa TUFC12733]